MGIKLTDKQLMFVSEYLIDLNATQAAIRSGYSEKTAKQTGCENLAKPDIQAAIAKAMDKRAQRNEITADRVLQEIAKIGFLDVRNIFTNADHLKAISTLPDDIAAAVVSVEVVARLTGGVNDDGTKEIEHVHKIKLADKLKGLEMLGRHLVLFSDKVVHSGFIESTEELSREELFRIAATGGARDSEAGRSSGKPAKVH